MEGGLLYCENAFSAMEMRLYNFESFAFKIYIGSLECLARGHFHSIISLLPWSRKTKSKASVIQPPHTKKSDWRDIHENF